MAPLARVPLAGEISEPRLLVHRAVPGLPVPGTPRGGPDLGRHRPPGRIGGARPVRALGWAALVLPMYLVVVGLRGRGSRRPDLAVAVLGLTLEASSVLRLHGVLGVLVGVG